MPKHTGTPGVPLPSGMPSTLPTGGRPAAPGMPTPWLTAPPPPTMPGGIQSPPAINPVVPTAVAPPPTMPTAVAPPPPTVTPSLTKPPTGGIEGFSAGGGDGKTTNLDLTMPPTGGIEGLRGGVDEDARILRGPTSVPGEVAPIGPAGTQNKFRGTPQTLSPKTLRPRRGRMTSPQSNWRQRMQAQSLRRNQ